jgi:predicted secreted protein
MVEGFRGVRLHSVTWLSLALVPLFACSGCHDGGAPAVSAPETSAPIADAGTPSAVTAVDGGSDTVIHLEDDGKSFDVARGATVTLSLASNAGTGYAWTPTKIDATVLVQQGDRTVVQNAPGVPGGPTSEVFQFVAQVPGTTTLEMSLKRGFGNGQPARVLHLTINIH